MSSRLLDDSDGEREEERVREADPLDLLNEGEDDLRIPSPSSAQKREYRVSKQPLTKVEVKQIFERSLKGQPIKTQKNEGGDLADLLEKYQEPLREVFISLADQHAEAVLEEKESASQQEIASLKQENEQLHQQLLLGGGLGWVAAFEAALVVEGEDVFPAVLTAFRKWRGLPGNSLREVLEKQGRFTEEQLEELALQLVDPSVNVISPQDAAALYFKWFIDHLSLGHSVFLFVKNLFQATPATTEELVLSTLPIGKRSVKELVDILAADKLGVSLDDYRANYKDVRIDYPPVAAAVGADQNGFLQRVLEDVMSRFALAYKRRKDKNNARERRRKERAGERPKPLPRKVLESQLRDLLTKTAPNHQEREELKKKLQSAEEKLQRAIRASNATVEEKEAKIQELRGIEKRLRERLVSGGLFSTQPGAVVMQEDSDQEN
jgi:hypothetical protein